MLSAFKQNCAAAIISHTQNLGMDVFEIRRDQILVVLKALKNDPETPFDQLLDICGVDYPKKQDRFEVVYHLYSLKGLCRVRLKVSLPESDPVVDSAMPVYEIADWFEREAFDMLGIQFKGHPNLKRLLMWTDFKGHPLRKDYPINKRQPIPTLDDIV